VESISENLKTQGTPRPHKEYRGKAPAALSDVLRVF
jgi:hypothetical protein